MLGAEWIRGGVLHLLQRAGDMPTKLIRYAQPDQSAQRPLTIRGGGVEQDACHWPLFVFRIERGDALTYAGGGIATFKRQRAHKRVRKLAKQHIAQSRIALFWLFPAS